MEVVEDERERGLDAELPVDAGLPDRARWRVEEVRAVVGLAVVVAGGPEAERDPEDEERR